MQHTTRPLVTVLQILVLLAAVARVSSGVAAANSGSDWLKPAREALSVARQTLQSFDPGAGNTEELDPWDRVLGEIRLNAQKCIDARAEDINTIKAAVDVADEAAAGSAAETVEVEKERLHIT